MYKGTLRVKIYTISYLNNRIWKKMYAGASVDSLRLFNVATGSESDSIRSYVIWSIPITDPNTWTTPTDFWLLTSYRLWLIMVRTVICEYMQTKSNYQYMRINFINLFLYINSDNSTLHSINFNIFPIHTWTLNINGNKGKF